MSEQDPTRKTLTIKKRGDTPDESSSERPRVRIGARARRVAQQKITKDKTARSNTMLRSGPNEFRAPGERARPLTDRSPRSAAPKALPQVQSNRAQRESSTLQSSTVQASLPATIVSPTTEIFHIFAPCPVGLEEALSAELSALGYEQVQATRAGCHFVADWWGVQRANLYSRLATRILVRVGQAPVQQEDDILELAQSIGWERWFGAEHTLRVDTSAVKSPMQSLQYCNLRAKDGICDRLRDLEGARPSIDTVRPDARVHLFLSQDTATMYLDTSGESLFKRGWRLDKGDAPLRENLAAGLLALSGWDPQAALLDPFCGSGTILIEAAWIALGVPPGINRPFGFERLRDHESRPWEDLKEDARSRILPELEAPLVGIDANPEAIDAAQRNAERACLTEETIQFEIGDARDAVAPAPNGWILTNPPYGERLDEEDLEFWREWSANLKREFAGWQVNIITSDLDLPKHLRLKANRRTPIFNGALDCRLFNFELVESSYRNVATTQQKT
ncbi:THUMP domain-containing class I SAM-dependent RNA methyltransferase [Zwartia vadi]|uniref:THUMP domain-containing class I SAM-dependent RNA methyltransferase n=1 Tax=Zwartia vadi TaxID=3058168 RepID=UPI0025B4BFC2|nr:THUMP domain-containing protein [Zwartia vadi]MDN3987161.1 THUMP domain-containing protein [Zwartia vadi]